MGIKSAFMPRSDQKNGWGGANIERLEFIEMEIISRSDNSRVSCTVSDEYSSHKEPWQLCHRHSRYVTRTGQVCESWVETGVMAYGLQQVSALVIVGGNMSYD